MGLGMRTDGPGNKAVTVNSTHGKVKSFPQTKLFLILGKDLLFYLLVAFSIAVNAVLHSFWYNISFTD